MTVSDLAAASPDIPVGADGPVFAAPWEARVFAMTLQAHEAGLFRWPEWAEALGAELATDITAPTGKTYYEHWLTAFETLLDRKGVASLAALGDLQQAWDRAARATPHGQPIELLR